MPATLRRALTVLLALVVTSGVLVGVTQTSASAAWARTTTVHQSTLQVCKIVRPDLRLRFRLDNRAAGHAHRGGVSRTRARSTFFGVRAAAGRLSDVRSIPVRPGDRLETSVGDVNGASAGGGLSMADVPRC